MPLFSLKQESIYDWAEKDPEQIIRPEKYVSIHHKNIQRERVIDKIPGTEPNTKILQSFSCLSSHKTMGYPETPLNRPCEFLRKNKGIKFVRLSSHECHGGPSALPTVQKHDKQCATHRKKIKDFKKLNKEAIVHSVPKRKIPKVVYTREGSKHLLCNSGLMPSYIFSPNYGKIPKTIIKIKKCLAKNHAKTMEQKKSDLKLPEGIRALTNEERQKVISGLKKNWWETTLQFNTIPVIVDTIPMRVRKYTMELYLRQIEQDLMLLENNPIIFICEDD